MGKCSLTVALPIISACGVETAVLPTAILSAHTLFNNYSYNDLTDDIDEITDGFRKEKFLFDGIYSGFLGSAEQIEKVADIFAEFTAKDGFSMVDPVMADNGAIYRCFDLDFVKRMKWLCSKADIIVPNLTEATFMLEREYVESGYSEEYIRELLVALCDNGSKIAVLTGVSFEEGKLGAYGYDSERDYFFSSYGEHLPVKFHGTGDAFASAFCGALARGNTLQRSLDIAVEFVVESIRLTLNNPDHVWYGVEFEKALPILTEKVNK